MTRALFLASLPLLAAGCMTADGASDSGAMTSAAADAAGRATLASADGGPRGTATVSETGGGLMVHAELQGLPPGVHGIHIHTTGRCEAPDFQSAGPHWNPTNKDHGAGNPRGAHYGDLPNVTIGPDGRGMLHATVTGATLAGLFDADGSALVVHADPDDYKTDPSGSSGARIACGVFERS